MPAQMHPRLAELERQAAEAETEPTPVEEEVADAPSEEVAEVEASPVAEPEAPVEARDEEAEFYLKLDKRRAYQSLRELAEQEKGIADALATMVGRKASQQYKPEIESLRAELAATKTELRRRDFEKMTDQEVSQRFGTDPQFAREYTEAVHSKPIDVNLIRQKQQVNAAFHAELDRAEANGVPPERVAQIDQWIATGQFDHDPRTGQPMAPIQSYQWLQDVVNRDITAFRKPAQQIIAPPAAPAAPVAAPKAEAAPAPEKRKPAPNPRLQDSSPDLSASSHSGSGIERISREEYRRMNPLERMARWQTPGDFEREVKAGLFTD